MPDENHCGQFECPAAERITRGLRGEARLLAEIERDYERARREIAVWERLFAQILRVPS